MSASQYSASRANLTINDLKTPIGLRIAAVEISSHEICLNQAPFAIPANAHAKLRIEILYSDLQAYLDETKPGGLSGFSVRMLDGELAIVALTRLLVLVQVGAKGKLELQDKALYFVASRVEVAGVKAPENLSKEQLDRINPILDFSGFPVEVSDFLPEYLEDRIRIAANVRAVEAVKL